MCPVINFIFNYYAIQQFLLMTERSLLGHIEHVLLQKINVCSYLKMGLDPLRPIYTEFKMEAYIAKRMSSHSSQAILLVERGDNQAQPD